MRVCWSNNSHCVKSQPTTKKRCFLTPPIAYRCGTRRVLRKGGCTVYSESRSHCPPAQGNLHEGKEVGYRLGRTTYFVRHNTKSTLRTNQEGLVVFRNTVLLLLWSYGSSSPDPPGPLRERNLVRTQSRKVLSPSHSPSHNTSKVMREFAKAKPQGSPLPRCRGSDPDV